MRLADDISIGTQLVLKASLAVILMATSTIGLILSCLGTLMWLSIVVDAGQSPTLIMGLLLPLALCVCIRNLGSLLAFWVEMEWRPLIEVSIISIASIVIMFACFKVLGASA